MVDLAPIGRSTEITITVLAGLVLLPIVYYAIALFGFVQKTRRVARAVENFPGPPTHWLLGNLKHLGPGLEGRRALQRMADKYKRSFRIWFGPIKPSLVIWTTEGMKAVMNTSQAKPVGFAGGYASIPPWIGDGLLVSSGEKWFRNRKLLTPGFHFDVLKPYMKIYNAAVDTFMENIAGDSTEGNSIEISKRISLCTLSIILRCAFSYDEDVQTQGKPYLFPDIVYYMTPTGRQYRRYLKLAHDMSSSVIAQRREALKAKNENLKRHPDFLDILLLARDENGKGLNDTEIRDEVDTFLFEGHDTTASAISWVLYELAKHPADQERCREEVTSLLSGRPDAQIEWKDLQEIQYFILCIKEAMRLHSPVPAIGRKTTEPLKVEGVTLAVGTDITMRIDLHHLDKDVWGEDAMEFKPERFSYDRTRNMDSHAYVPFSAGPRNCIGQNFAMHEIKVMVAKVLYRFDMKLDKNHKVESHAELVTRPVNGIKIMFTQRY